jgi:hypothetical protein
LNADNKAGPLAKLTQSLFSKGLDQPHAGLAASRDELALGRIAIKDFSNARVLERLLMYERRLEHSLYKTLLEIQRLNVMRKLNPRKTDDEELVIAERAVAETAYQNLLAGKADL